MKQIYKLGYILFACGLLFTLTTSCKSDNESTSPLLIGETTDTSEVRLSASAERKIILRGGNKKYDASIADAQIARLTIVKDTLKIQGLLEGSTYATITTAEHTRKLNIIVEAQDISLSKTDILLTPGDVSDIVSVTGGGLGLTLQVDNPEGAIETPTIDKSGKLQIKAKHEGDATINFVAAGKETRSLSVKVRQTTTTDKYGFYKTTNSTPYNEIATPLIVERRGVGYALYNTVKPNANTKRLFVALTAVPTKGEILMLNLKSNQLDTKYQAGEYRFVVEDVSEKAIRLRGQGFRLILPRK